MPIKNAVLLAGGNGIRLRPTTQYLNKHLLTINNKFIIDYPINSLKSLGVQNITVILGGEHFAQIVNYLQDGRQFGVNINYLYQGEAKGIAHAINLCERFLYDEEQFIVMLGDNIFDGDINFKENFILGDVGCQILLDQQKMNDPDIKRFGTATINKGRIIKLEEKPQELILDPSWISQSNYPIAGMYPITGCYLFDHMFFNYFKSLKPSDRGEYEVIDMIQKYHKDKKLECSIFKGFWSDAGIPESITAVNNHFQGR